MQPEVMNGLLTSHRIANKKGVNRAAEKEVHRMHIRHIMLQAAFGEGVFHGAHGHIARALAENRAPNINLQMTREVHTNLGIALCRLQSAAFMLGRTLQPSTNKRKVIHDIKNMAMYLYTSKFSIE